MKRFLALKSRNVIMVVAGAMFMVQLDASVLAVALPQMARDFGRPVVSVSLAITIYLTMLVTLLPISGWAAERLGLRRVFVGAVLCFALFSLCCALASHFWLFILFRALEGAAASLLVPVGRLLMLRTASRDELVDALSITAMPMLVAPTIGPLLSGYIVETAGWPYIFLLNLPVALLLLVMARRHVPVFQPDRTVKLDFVGAALLGSALMCVLTGIDRMTDGILAPLPLALLLAGSSLLALAVRHMRRHAAPLLSLDVLRLPGFRSTTIGAGALVRLPARAVLFLLPLMFQLGLGLSPLLSGFLLLALNGGDLVAKPFIKPWFDRFGFRTSLFWSSLVGLAALAVIVPVGAGPFLVPFIMVMLFVAGFARSVLFTGVTTLSFLALDRETVVSGNVISGISMQLFNAIAVSGTALVLGLTAHVGGQREPDLADYRITLAILVLLGLMATFRFRRQIPHRLDDGPSGLSITS